MSNTQVVANNILTLLLDKNVSHLLLTKFTYLVILTNSLLSPNSSRYIVHSLMIQCILLIKQDFI